MGIQYSTYNKEVSKIVPKVTIETYQVQQKVKLFDTSQSAPNLMLKTNILV